MFDLTLATFWLLVLAGALAAGVVLARRGVPTTYVRDLIHVGAGSWVLGWPYWREPVAPIVLVTLGLLGVLLAPRLATRLPAARALVGSLTGGDERWAGVVLYVVAYAVLTPLGLLVAPFPAAAALLALALGDGLGGLVGRSVGRHGYNVPWGKRKSVEGSLVVAAGAAVALLAAGWAHGVSSSVGQVLSFALVAAGVEAVSPRSSDNLLMPAALVTLGLLQGDVSAR